MNFAANLKQLRNQRNLTQKEFAEIMGTSPSAITMYETGQREPNFTLLDRIATYFDVSTDHLLGRDITHNDDSKDEEYIVMIERINSMQYELDEMKNKIESKFR